MIASALLALALASIDVARAQTASLFPVGFQDGPLAGTPVGTGAEGTTYEISGTFTELDVPFTMTLVQDATRVSEDAIIATGGAAVTINAACALGASEATCVEVVANEGTATTITESGPYDLVGVPVGTDVAPGPGSASASATGARTSITFSSSGSGGGGSDVSVIPPSISLGGTRSTATGATATLTGSSGSGSSTGTGTGISAPGTGSGAAKNAFAGGVGVTLTVGPALLALLVTL